MDSPLSRLKAGINSAAENMKYRPNALDDIESDLEYALAAVKELIAEEVKERNEMYDGWSKFGDNWSKFGEK